MNGKFGIRSGEWKMGNEEWEGIMGNFDMLVTIHTKLP